MVVCREQRSRQRHFLKAESDAHAATIGLMTWEELAAMMPDTCGDPEGRHIRCGDFKVCSLCKLAKDDATYNPLYPNSDGWNYIPQGFQALQENPRDFTWMQDDPRKSMQNLFNLVANGYFLKDDKATLKNWGFLMLEPEDAEMVAAAPSYFAFVEHQVDLQG